MMALCLRREYWFKYGFSLKKIGRPSFTGTQTLFTPSSLGVDKFLLRQEFTKKKFPYSKQTFIEKITELCKFEERDCYIYTEDLKNMIYLCENNSDDIKILTTLTRKYMQGQKTRSTDFNLGPEFMRLFYHLNLPHEAKQVLNEDGKGLFNQVSSYVILMTLLYNSSLYQDVIEVMYKMVSERFTVKHFPKPNMILTTAACYKMNSSNSLKEAISLVKKADAAGSKYDARTMSFIAALALQQDSPHVALELTSKSYEFSCLLKNIKAEAFVQLGCSEESLPILRGSTALSSLRSSDSDGKDGIILADTVRSVEKALNEENKKEALSEFNLIKKSLEDKSLILEKSIDELLCEPIKLQRQDDPLSERQKKRARITSAFRRGNRFSDF